MLFAAENTSWIHKDGTVAVSATPLLDDPVVAQIAPFAVLLVSSLLTGAILIHPESGYPFRLAVMATTVFLFFKHFRAETGTVAVVSLLSGMLVALIWLGVKAGGAPLTVILNLRACFARRRRFLGFMPDCGHCAVCALYRGDVLSRLSLAKARLRRVAGKGCRCCGIVHTFRGSPFRYSASVDERRCFRLSLSSAGPSFRCQSSPTQRRMALLRLGRYGPAIGLLYNSYFSG